MCGVARHCRSTPPFYLIMKAKTVTLAIAETKVNIKLLLEETCDKFASFLTEYDADAPVTGITQDELVSAKKKYPDFVSDSIIEFNELMIKVVTLLLKQGMPAFHGTAFIWDDKAWIFAGPSGTGKTTQYFMWKVQYRDEIRMLNGDKTILRCEDDGSVTVFPTPWAGKEGMSRMESATLGGIIFLAQDSENSIEPLDLRSASKLFSPQFIFVNPTEADAYVLNKTYRAMLQSASIWYFRNKGDMESAKLAHDTILNSI